MRASKWWLGLALLALVACAAPAAAPRAPSAAAPPGPAAPASAVQPASAAPAPTAPAPQHLKMVVGTLSVAITPLIVARDLGFAARHGLDLEVIVARSGAEAMAALLSQDAPIG